jgi:hypothetical protein
MIINNPNRKPYGSSDSESITKKPIKYGIFIVDQSGSMAGSKWRAAVEGCQEILKAAESEFDALFVGKFGQYYCGTQTILEGLNRGNCRVLNTSFGDEGATALHLQTIAILEACDRLDPEDHILINIFTDGGDNVGYGINWHESKVREKIAQLAERNVTFTFTGTSDDTQDIIQKYDLSVQNTAVHDNTAKGILEVSTKFRKNMVSYSANVDAGIANTKSFFNE